MFWTVVTSLFPGLVKAFFEYQSKKADRELEGFKTASGVDREAFRDHLQATLENNRIKLAANGWWGAKVIILMAGVPMAAHMAAVALDTLIPPFGSWGIPKLPPPYDQYERDIVLSFFIVMPAMPLVSAMATWMGRK